jgi:hypothetical protein
LYGIGKPFLLILEKITADIGGGLIDIGYIRHVLLAQPRPVCAAVKSDDSRYTANQQEIYANYYNSAVFANACFAHAYPLPAENLPHQPRCSANAPSSKSI